MDRHTNILIRIAMHFLLVGAIGEIGAVLFMAHVPSLSTAIGFVGIASLMLCERRLRALTGPLGRRVGGAQ